MTVCSASLTQLITFSIFQAEFQHLGSSGDGDFLKLNVLTFQHRLYCTKIVINQMGQLCLVHHKFFFPMIWNFKFHEFCSHESMANFYAFLENSTHPWQFYDSCKMHYHRSHGLHKVTTTKVCVYKSKSNKGVKTQLCG